MEGPRFTYQTSPMIRQNFSLRYPLIEIKKTELPPRGLYSEEYITEIKEKFSSDIETIKDYLKNNSEVVITDEEITIKFIDNEFDIVNTIMDIVM